MKKGFVSRGGMYEQASYSTKVTMTGDAMMNVIILYAV